MYVWSLHIAEYGSTGYGCPSCSWSAGKMIISLSPWEPENLASRDGFVAERSKCPDKRKYNFYTMLVVFSAGPDAQDSVMNSQDTVHIHEVIGTWPLNQP